MADSRAEETYYCAFCGRELFPNNGNVIWQHYHGDDGFGDIINSRHEVMPLEGNRYYV